MTVKLVAIDMDSTLLRHDKTYDEDRFYKVSHALKEKGVLTCVASGNSIPRLISYFDASVQEDIYFAADNGNYIIHNGDIKRAIGVEREEMERLMTYLNENKDYHVIICSGETAYAKKKDYDKEVLEQFHTYYDEVTYIDSFYDIPEEAPITKIAMLTQQSLDENKEFMNQIIDELPRATSVTSGASWMDVYHLTGGKGNAIKYLQEKYNITKSETIAFGDSLNDASMMEEAKYSVAMQNADPDLKRYCDYEIGTNEEQAVLDILETIVDQGDLEFIEEYWLEK